MNALTLSDSLLSQIFVLIATVGLVLFMSYGFGFVFGFFLNDKNLGKKIVKRELKILGRFARWSAHLLCRGLEKVFHELGNLFGPKKKKP